MFKSSADSERSHLLILEDLDLVIEVEFIINYLSSSRYCLVYMVAKDRSDSFELLL